MSVISITDLVITDGMYQFRKEEREFLERKNDISSLLRWKSRDQEIMISYTNMEYLPLFLRAFSRRRLRTSWRSLPIRKCTWYV